MDYEPVYLEAHEGINRFVQLTYQMLNSSVPVPLSRMEAVYLAMHNAIHERARDSALDAGAFLYVCARLPPCIFSVTKILLGQSESILKERGVLLGSWTEVYAKARRRKYLYNGKETLIAFIASKSDIDDIIPALLALQIEWNKAKGLLQQLGPIAGTGPLGAEFYREIAAALGIDALQMEKLQKLFGEALPQILKTLQEKPCGIAVQNYEASYCRYRRETEIWWNTIYTVYPEIETRPVYFVSSNSHSLINLLSGFAEAHREEIAAYGEGKKELLPFVEEYRRFSAAGEAAGREEGGFRVRLQNILFYLLMKYEQDPLLGEPMLEKRLAWEKKAGIVRIESPKTLDIPTQIIDLQKLALFRRGIPGSAGLPDFPEKTRAVILNIDYPLGRTAYFILGKIAEHISKLLGVFVIGKAASLIADRGDVIIPSVVMDQHTRNQYFFENCIKARDIIPFMDIPLHGIYDNQRAVTVLGTLLQNNEMLYAFQAAGITDIEMEAGPYLSTIYEMTRPKRYPENETISITSLDMDIGIVHYVSDNPLSHQRLADNLDRDGISSTYASTNAVLRKIFLREGGLG
ncbi:MAG: hypothetical protein LBP42_00770 [Treponema sp.]|jgi:hypothetical protein|nr:hypothetical protein [Treponema sp.]